MMSTTLDLSAVPPPTIIKELDYEAIVARQNARFQGLWEGLRAVHTDLPAYDVSMLETDPAVTLNEAESYREILLLGAINDAARARLLAFAKDGDLDQLAVFYDVYRLPGEDDTRLKIRVILAIQGRSTGGPKERYQSVAMSSDLRVEWAEPYRIGRSPVIYVAIFSTEADGVASADLLSKVSAALTADSVQLVNDTIIVQPAVRKVANLSADVWLLPDADEATVARAEANLRAAWETEQKLGRDLVSAWWVSKLMISGMHKVAPTSTADESALPTEAISIGSVSLTLRGRAF